MMRRGERGKEERVAEETGKGCMEWDLKTPSWDLAELEREAMAPLVGSSNFGEHKFKGDCLVDLKLGRLGDFGDGSLDKSKDPRISTMLSSSLSSQSSSSKRARPPGNVTQTASCSVDGCTSDLSNCRDYHRRHKVCEVHSKTPTVMVGGQAQRFCQQCSRFHVLAEFDEAKRSCRKRLDGHNRRRRKPQPESLSVNSGNLLSNHQGFCRSPNPQIFTTTSVVSAAWTGVVKTEEDATICNHHFINRQSPFGGSFSNSYKGAGKQFPFMQSNATTIANQTVQEASFCQPPLNTIALSQSEGGRKIFSNGLNRVMDSDCALSLLSSQSTQTSGVSLNNVVRLESIPMARPLVPGLQYNGLGRYSSGGMEDEQMNSVLVTDTSDADLHCQGVFHMGSDEHSQDMGHQTLPFAWE